MHDLKYKNQICRFRLSDQMKSDLQAMAEREGTTMSAFLRDYLDETLYQGNLDRPAPNISPASAPEAAEGLDSVILFRVPAGLRQAYKETCQQQGLRASEILRAFMRDFVASH